MDHIAVGKPSISEAPQIRIAQSTSGLIHVWVAGTGYLNKEEKRELAEVILAGIEW